MAHTSKDQQIALPERPKPPSTEEMLEDLQTADDRDVAFTVLQNLVNDMDDDVRGKGAATNNKKLNKNLEETHASIINENTNENTDISKEYNKVKKYLEANEYLETNQETLQVNLNKLMSAKVEIENVMKQLQEELGGS
ncbi:uncharacterized protein [Antedon mediterranea]|uniref:uncharacterized protein n=1 Tax=Antedon mediterranea TaxID=105859 RepID=UPI003AF9316E